MIKVLIVEDWWSDGTLVELPGVPRRGDVVILNEATSGTVEEVVWEPGEPVKVMLG